MDIAAMGRRIREERKKKGLTQEQLAEKADISAYFMGQVERGDRKASIVIIHNIAVSLDTSIDYLVFGYIAKSNVVLHQLVDKVEQKHTSLLEKILRAFIS